jgi:hypothetical protein
LLFDVVPFSITELLVAAKIAVAFVTSTVTFAAVVNEVLAAWAVAF